MLSQKEGKWDYIIDSKRGWFDININEIWEFRDLLIIFIKRDFITIYKQTILGPIWYFLQPLITTIVFTIIFNKVAKLSTNQIPPMLFYMSGIIAWNYFSNCLLQTSSTFTSNAELFSKVYFPRIIVPFSQVISALLRFFVQLVMFFIFYVYFILSGFSIEPAYAILFFLPIMIIQMAILGKGIGMIVSSLTTKYRDLSHLVTFGTQLLMYASPIVYPLSIVPDNYRYIILANPMTSIIEFFRNAVFNNGNININMILYSLGMTMVIYFIGLLIFNKIEKNFIDTV